MRLARAGRRLVAGVKRRVPVRIKRPARNLLRRAGRRWRAVFPSKPPTAAPLSGVLVVGGRLKATGESVASVRTAAAGIDLSQTVAGIDVTVTGWRRPYPGWSGRVGALPGLLSHAVGLPESDIGRATVRADVARPIQAQSLLDAALAALEPAHTVPSTLTAAMLIDGVRPLWLAGKPLPVDGRPTAPGEQARRWASAGATDVRLTSDSVDAGTESGVALYSRYGLVTPGEPTRILLDIAYDNPIGRGPWHSELASGVLTVETPPDGEATWRVTAAKGSAVLVAGRAGDPLSEKQRAALVALGAVHCGEMSGDPVPCAAVLAQLAATGVVLDAPKLPGDVRALLAPELSEIITAPAPGGRSDGLEWEARSVAQRRAAMRGHDAGLTASPARPDGALPTVTALVVTRRTHFVRRVMASLAAQTYPRLEVVVALHGAELDAAARDELTALPIPVDVVELSDRLSLGEALSEATLRARGSLVTKVDDDDQYGPEHVWDLVLARRYSGATVVGKGPEFVYLATHDLTVRREWTSETFDKVVAGGTIMIARGDLEAVGGWRPVPRSVDRTLLERILLAGGLVYRAHPFGFVYTRHNEGHTWDPGGAEFFRRNPVREWPGLPATLLDSRALPAVERDAAVTGARQQTAGS